MARDATDQSADIYDKSHVTKIWGIIFVSGLALVILTSAWIVLRSQVTSGSILWSSPGSIFVLSVLLILLTILIERMLRSLIYTIETRFRMSVLISAITGWLFFLITSIAAAAFNMMSVSNLPTGMFFLALSLISAFVGGLMLTVYHQGFIENNHPPSKEIELLVYERHKQLIGSPATVSASKRLFDISISSAGLILSAPIWFLSAFLIWFENPGPLLFVKNSVGKGGENFRQYKFRTMIRGAEENTGPVMAAEGDQRVLRIGKLLRKTALDELPQLINILQGEMSFVGPRPQRTIMVNEYLMTIPEYAERHQVLPGLAGLAQVAGDYFLTPRQKLRFDRVYIRHANLTFDILLIILAFLITFWYRWQPDWNGKVPRRLLHGKPSN